MKITFYLGDFNNTGGIERVTTTLANYFTEVCNLDVDIVSTFKSKEMPSYNVSPKVNIHYINNVSPGAVPHSFKRILNRFKVIGAVKRFFKDYDTDLIIAQAFPNNLSLWLSGVEMSKVISAEHVYANYYGKIVKKIRLYIYKKSAKVVVLTNNDKKIFDKNLPVDKTVVIPNPINVSTLCQSPLINKEIISIGRLQYQKGYENLIDVFKKVHERYPDWHLSIYGEGVMREELQRKIDDNGLSQVFHLRGITNDVQSALRESSIYVMSSRFEGFPMVLIEAMAQGVPCISYDCPNGPSDIIKNMENGILVVNQDKNALFEAISYLIENKEERIRMGLNALVGVGEYSVENVSNKWIELFSVLIGNRKK